MGNKCFGCSCTREDAYLKGSKKSGHKKKKQAGNVLPEDLHASSGSRPKADSFILERPASLEFPQEQKERTSKFPAFHLHGVQKSSPTITEGGETPISTETPVAINTKKIEQLFEVYRDSSQDEDAILADGVEKFCLDLEVDPTDFIVLALAWKFKAETMCKFTRKEFTEGFISLHCDSISSLKLSFNRLEIEALENFKDLYRYTFQFALDEDQGQRSLPCNIATAMWGVVFSRNPPSLLEPWLQFLQENKVRGISRDTWNMFLYLTESLNDDYSNYNDKEAWPSLFDDFVDYQKELQQNKEHEANRTRDVEEDVTMLPKDDDKSIESTTSGHATETSRLEPSASSESCSLEDVDLKFESAPLESSVNIGDGVRDVSLNP